MITPDDNGYGRVKRWREKNRAYVNMAQREYRKRKKDLGSIGERNQRLHTSEQTSDSLKSLVGGVKPEPKPSAQEFKPRFFHDDNGRRITEAAWNLLQEKKKVAKEGGYEIDDYSQ